MLWRRGKAYGQDLRERVFAAADIGTPVGEIAEMLLVSISSAYHMYPRPCRGARERARSPRGRNGAMFHRSWLRFTRRSASRSHQRLT